MDWDKLLYIAIFILFSVLSGSRANKKKREEQNKAPDDGSLEEEIRRMAEKMMGKKEEEPVQKTVEAPSETFRSLSDEQRTSPYSTFDDDRGDEKYEKYNRLPDTKRVDYSEQDIDRVEQQHEKQKIPTYARYASNYDTITVDSFNKGKELHTLMGNKTQVLAEKEVVHPFIEDFDARKAVIYAEIFKRPEY